MYKPFKAYDPGYFHIDVKYLPQMPNETARRYLFVAIDRATRWVFVQIKPNKTAAAAKAFLKVLQKAAPRHIQTILTDNELTASGFASPSNTSPQTTISSVKNAFRHTH